MNHWQSSQENSDVSLKSTFSTTLNEKQPKIYTYVPQTESLFAEHVLRDKSVGGET